MRVDFVTIFPGFYESPLNQSLVQKAREKGLLDVRVHNLRDFTEDRHSSVDGQPFGGGSGMVFKAEPIARAIENIRLGADKRSAVVLTSAQGRLFRQDTARELAGYDQVIFICPRYKGVDERVAESLADMELSIGDYVVQGGDAAAWVMFEAFARLVEGVVGDEESVETDSFFADAVFEGPQYTRPREFRGMAVPEVLVSGNHAEIARWRRRRAVEKTLRNRPDLIQRIRSAETRSLLKEVEAELATYEEVNTHG